MSYFAPKLFEFLKDLKAYNNRPWFESNKARYEGDVKEPMLRFITDLGPRLRKVSPHLAADPRPVSGSMFRIYRDIRFSRDKSPYKTNVGAHFPHARTKDVHAPGLTSYGATSGGSSIAPGYRGAGSTTYGTATRRCCSGLASIRRSFRSASGTRRSV